MPACDSAVIITYSSGEAVTVWNVHRVVIMSGCRTHTLKNSVKLSNRHAATGPGALHSEYRAW